MDYIGYTMNICLILFMISVTGSHCQYYSNRDIILTPHQLKTYPGKILYYRPHELPTGPGVLDNVVPAQQGAGPATAAVATSTAVPWEEVLKETVFLALNDNKTSAKSADGSTTTKQPLYIARQQKAIYGAPYIGSVDLSVPRFGDIVELAHGRLEQEDDESYFFVQDDPNTLTSTVGRNVSAYWKVERIRHRDEQRGHRYELKFTVAPMRDFQLDENAIVNRSFIVRDEDYPRYFGMASPNAIPMMKKNDQFVERAVFDPLFPPYHPSFTSNRYFRPTQATITLGEYLLQSLLSGGETTIKQKSYAPNPYRFGSAFNRVKFPDTFTTSSQTVPKYYHHIHFQRPSIAPLAPTAPPMPPYIREAHTASSNVQQDYTKLVDFRGGNESSETSSSVENKPVAQQPQQFQQSHRYPPPIMPIQPTHIHHHHHQLPLQQQQQQQQQQPQQQQQLQQPQLLNQPFNNNPPPLQPLPQNLVQSIPVFNPQGQVMLNHIPIAPNHMYQVSQGPVAFPVHFQLVPSPGQIYAPQQTGLNAIPIRFMQQAPVHIYPVNPFLTTQNHQDYITTKYPNHTQHYPHHPNSIPTTLKYTSFKYTPQPSTSPLASPTSPNYRYASLPTIQASPAGQREKFTAPGFRPASSSTVSPHNKLEPETAGSSPIDSSSSPKFQSFGIENAVTPKTTAAIPIATAAEQNFTPSIGHTSSVHSGFFSNFLDEKGAVSQSGKLYSEPDPLYHKHIGTTPISFTTPYPSVSSSGAFSHTARPNFTPKFTLHPSYKGIPSPTIVPPQIETPISSTLKSYHYLAHHDSFDFVPSRVVELAHVKKIPKKSGSKRKNHGNHGNHHHVTVTSNKPLKFNEAPDYATRRPESHLSVQLPPPEKDFTYYGTSKQNHKVQRPKNYVTQPYTSSTTPFPTSLTTPSNSTTASTTPIPATTTPSGSTTATTEKPFTQFQPFYKNKNEKSDDIITTMRPRLVIKTIYKQFPTSSAANSASAAGTEKPVLKWIPKRPRNKSNTSAEPSSSSSSATSSSASIEQISASSEHSTVEPVSANKSQPASVTATARSSLENQMNRLRASRGRSRYTHRRVTTPRTPSASQHPIAKVHRVRTSSSSTTTSTSTIKPISGVTSSAFDSNRLDNRPPTESEDRQPEESAVAPISLKNMSNEKSKRDTATEENEILVAEPLVSKLSIGKDPNYEMTKADIKTVETNSTNIMLFEASDASIGPTGSSVPTFDELTMSIINHARAIANKTAKPEDLYDKTLESNEISHKDDGQTTVPMVSATTVMSSTSEPPAESTILDQTATTYGGDSNDESDSDTTGSSRSETTVSVDH